MNVYRTFAGPDTPAGTAARRRRLIPGLSTVPAQTPPAMPAPATPPTDSGAPFMTDTEAAGRYARQATNEAAMQPPPEQESLLSIQRRAGLNQARAAETGQEVQSLANTALRQKAKKKGYSFYDPQSRAEHPIVTALVANALRGREGPEYVHALDEMDRDRKEKAINEGRQLAEITGDPNLLHPDDPYRETLSSTISKIKPHGPTQEEVQRMEGAGYVWDPAERKFVESKTKPTPTQAEIDDAASKGLYYDRIQNKFIEAHPPKKTTTPDDATMKSMEKKGQFWDPVAGEFRTDPTRQKQAEAKPPMSLPDLVGNIARRHVELRRMQKERAALAGQIEALKKDEEYGAPQVPAKQAELDDLDGTIESVQAELEALEKQRSDTYLKESPYTVEWYEHVATPQQRKEHDAQYRKPTRHSKVPYQEVPVPTAAESP